MENNNGRNFMSSNLTEDMLKVVNVGGYMIDMVRRLEVKELSEVPDIISAIKNQALLGTLRKKGVIPAQEVVRFTLENNDRLFVVNAVDFTIRDWKDEQELPDTTTLEIHEYKIIKKHEQN